MKHHETARTDLFKLEGLEPPAGDLGIRPAFSSCRAIWTTPIAGEETAPAHRIIHARTLRLHAPAKLERLGEAFVFGGAKSGVDARSWDGWPCGYEGLLTDQFGILATALDRYQLKVLFMSPYL